MENQTINLAILDLYNNEPNEGMRGIQSILKQHIAPYPFKNKVENF
ncbi:MAG: hypothetical protein IPO63_18520 [Bacteroidetes bacterium]|nr:hypothetical protein [Bacteroidota bacterium]